MTNDRIELTSSEELTYKNEGGFIMNKLMKLMKNEKGMTLIELLAVIVIIAIIALIAIPAIGNIINNSHDKAILADASSIISGAKIAFTDGECESETSCTAENLKEFVSKDGTDLTGVSVTRDKNIYTLTYPELANMKGKLKGKVEGTITSDKLAELMGNKKEGTKE